MTPTDAVATTMLKPFKYGPADCFSAAMGASDLMTGGHGLELSRALYQTRRGAALVRMAHKDWSVAARELCPAVNFAPIEGEPWAGDLAIVGRSFAVCMGYGAKNSRANPLWASKTPRGVTVTEDAPVEVYRWKGAA